MYYERLLIEPMDDRWIRFRCPDRTWAGNDSGALLELPVGFTDLMILEALAATGWTRQQSGQWAIQDTRSCRDLVQLLYEMLAYFDGPDDLCTQIARLKAQIDEMLVNNSETDAAFDLLPWHYARLDLLLREELAQEAGELIGIWRHEVQRIETGEIRRRVIRNFRQEIQAGSTRSAGKMTASARTSGNLQDHRKSG